MEHWTSGRGTLSLALLFPAPQIFLHLAHPIASDANGRCELVLRYTEFRRPVAQLVRLAQVDALAIATPVFVAAVRHGKVCGWTSGILREIDGTICRTPTHKKVGRIGPSMPSLIGRFSFRVGHALLYFWRPPLIQSAVAHGNANRGGVTTSTCSGSACLDNQLLRLLVGLDAGIVVRVTAGCSG